MIIFFKKDLWILRELGQNIAFIRDKPFRGFRVKKYIRYMQKVHLHYYTPALGDTVVDIGAGNGDEILIYSQLVGTTGKVYAIEAHPVTFNCLQKSVDFNTKKNVQCHQLAISNNEGNLYIDNTDAWYANKIIDSKNNGFKVKSMTLDQYIREYNINHIDYLQMNIEGAEEEAIEAMAETLSITSNIAISCHDFLSENKTNKIQMKVQSILKNHGFKLFYNNTGIAYRDSWIFGSKNILEY